MAEIISIMAKIVKSLALRPNPSAIAITSAPPINLLIPLPKKMKPTKPASTQLMIFFVFVVIFICLFKKLVSQSKTNYFAYASSYKFV